MIGKNPFELGKNFDLALGMGPYFGPMRALEKDLVLNSCFIPCDVNGGDNFSINIEVNGEKQSTFQIKAPTRWHCVTLQVQAFVQS